MWAGAFWKGSLRGTRELRKAWKGLLEGRGKAGSGWRAVGSILANAWVPVYIQDCTCSYIPRLPASTHNTFHLPGLVGDFRLLSIQDKSVAIFKGETPAPFWLPHYFSFEDCLGLSWKIGLVLSHQLILQQGRKQASRCPGSPSYFHTALSKPAGPLNCSEELWLWAQSRGPH